MGFGMGGLLVGSGAVSTPKLKEGCGVPGVLNSRVNLCTGSAGATL